MEGKRSIADLFDLLDYVVVANGYHLQQLDDKFCPLAGPPVERSSPGKISAGNYVIGTFS